MQTGNWLTTTSISICEWAITETSDTNVKEF
jgi:hypothetical protein